eukprot:8379083-Pyramimonas_sp.AAC.1
MDLCAPHQCVRSHWMGGYMHDARAEASEHEKEIFDTWCDGQMAEQGFRELGRLDVQVKEQVGADGVQGEECE